VQLIPHQGVNLVPLGKPFDEIVLVLPHPFDEIGGHTDIERPISSTGQQIDARLLQIAHLSELWIPAVIPAKAGVIPAKAGVIPAKAGVIPAKAGIQSPLMWRGDVLDGGIALWAPDPLIGASRLEGALAGRRGICLPTFGAR
jgi:hypothetical protein